MPLILEVERAYNEAKADPAFDADLKHHLIALCRPPEPAVVRRTADKATRRREDLLQAR